MYIHGADISVLRVSRTYSPRRLAAPRPYRRLYGNTTAIIDYMCDRGPSRRNVPYPLKLSRKSEKFRFVGPAQCPKSRQTVAFSRRRELSGFSDNYDAVSIEIIDPVVRAQYSL